MSINKDSSTLLEETDNVDRTIFKKRIEHTNAVKEAIVAGEIIESGASYRNRKTNPDPRTINTGYAVEVDKGFQAPFVLGEGETLREAWENAKRTWEEEKKNERKFTTEELDFIKQNFEHIDIIRKFIGIASNELLKRGETHDRSKLDIAEVNTFSKYTSRLRNSEFGSDEYKENLKEMKEGSKSALDHHYKHNRHHPEHYHNGIKGMDLIDLIEMYIDWLASTRRHPNGNINNSIEINKNRFGMSDDLVSIFKNTSRIFKDGN